MKKMVLLPVALTLVTLAIFVSTSPVSAANESLSADWWLLDNFLRPNGETTLFINLQNSNAIGIYDIDLDLRTEPDLTVSPIYFTINEIASMTAKLTSFKVVASGDAPSATSYIEVKVTYHVGSARGDKKDLTVIVPVILKTVPLLQIEDIEYNPAVIEPGANVTLSFDVTNYGDGPAKDVIVSLDQTAGLFNVDLSEKYIGEVSANDFSRISFSLGISQDLEVGSYSFPISLAYKDETRNQVFTSTKFAGLKVYGKFNLILTLESQDQVASGTMGNMEIKISNAGTMEAQFLQLSVSDSDTLDEVFPSNIYIGGLKSDDYDTEKISFKIGDGVAKGVYPVSFELMYQDPFGKEFSETKVVQLSVLSPEELASKLEIPIWAIPLIVVLAILVVYYLRKRRK